MTYNTIGRHISKMVYTKVVSNKSPWLAQAETGSIYTNPASHGEGRFVAGKEWLVLSIREKAYLQIHEDADGRVFGKMAHAERRGESVAINIYGEQDMKLFESGVAYFK